MRKVKFTQDTFDEKIGRIVSEFPILDVRYHSWPMPGQQTIHRLTFPEPSPILEQLAQRSIRQEPLQACARSVEHCSSLDLASLERLCPTTQIR